MRIRPEEIVKLAYFAVLFASHTIADDEEVAVSRWLVAVGVAAIFLVVALPALTEGVGLVQLNIHLTK